MRVHPRACGGNRSGIPPTAFAVGASPRLRGKLTPSVPAGSGRRCIPAPAGETPVNSTVPASTAVHPRACGGNPDPADEPDAGNGASPRLRGKPSPRPCAAASSGCIPAPAGETGGRARLDRVPEVHPRACGGNLERLFGHRQRQGASPRLRGKRLVAEPLVAPLRCIPAPAGETLSKQVDELQAGVHPRACGGNEESAVIEDSFEGASPRLRGKPRQMAGILRSPGCIPAPAGETWWSRTIISEPWVHPRACGGNGASRMISGSPLGASPRLRGKLRADYRAGHERRCIPAPAGETFFGSIADRLLEVHPRACGGNSEGRFGGSLTIGASPRLRGKLPAVRPARPVPGCIPAPAGETCLVSCGLWT